MPDPPPEEEARKLRRVREGVTPVEQISFAMPALHDREEVQFISAVFTGQPNRHDLLIVTGQHRVVPASQGWERARVPAVGSPQLQQIVVVGDSGDEKE